MENRFRLTSFSSESDKIDNALKSYYNSWRKFNKKSKSSFTAIDNSFFKKKILSDLEPGPLRLYLYFSYVANNENGHSWHSISYIAEYFDAQTRTIDNWIKVLVDKDLIYRAQKGKKSHTTYLIPFSDTLIQYPVPKKSSKDNQVLLDDLITKIKDLEFLYGEIIKIHHLFQWQFKNESSTNPEQSIQILLIITKRSNNVLIGHIHVLRKSAHLSVSKLEIEEPSVFQSPFKFNEKNILGIALIPYPLLLSKTSVGDTINLLSELAEVEEWELKDRLELEYGDKNQLLPTIENKKEKEDVNSSKEKEKNLSINKSRGNES